MTPMDAPNWAKRLAKHQTSLSRRELDLVEWIVANPHEAAFAKLQDLADKAGVSKPTLISCYRQLDFATYQDFQAGIRDFYAGQIDSYHASTVALKDVSTVTDLVQSGLNVEVAAFETLRKNLVPELLETAGRDILRAGTVYVYGDGTGFYPAHYLVQRLRRCGIRAFLAGTDREHILDELEPITTDDVFLSFYYTQDPGMLEEVLGFCAAREAKNILVAGFLDPRHCQLAAYHIFVPRGHISFKNSMAVPMAFAQLLLLAVELIGGPGIANRLKNLEMTRRGISHHSKEES